jgi:hypothetical protein
MPNPRPTPRPRAPREPLPARCLRCGLAAVLEVQAIKRGVRIAKWQVKCRQCGAWSPGYPLVAPQKGEHTATGDPMKEA